MIEYSFEIGSGDNDQASKNYLNIHLKYMYFSSLDPTSENKEIWVRLVVPARQLRMYGFCQENFLCLKKSPMW